MPYDDTILRSLDWIESGIAEKLTVENLARGVGFSKYHYGRLFRDTVGETVMAYVARRRLALAGQALLTTDATVLDIALDCGYASHEHFTRSFRAQIGVSPTQLRRYGLPIVSPSRERERCNMKGTQQTEAMIRELNGWIARAKELAQEARRADGDAWRKRFWEGAADDLDALADRVKGMLGRMAEHPNEMENRFLLMNAVERAATEVNLLAFHQGLTVARSRPDAEYLAANCRLHAGFAELARVFAEKAEVVAGFMRELNALILDDMRKETARKIGDAVEKGRAAIAGIEGYEYIRREVAALVEALSPTEDVTVARVEGLLFRLRLVSFSIRTDVLRSGDAHAGRFAGIPAFAESLSAAAEFLRGLGVPGAPRADWDRTAEDVAAQASILAFYLRGEVSQEKLGRQLDDAQRAVLAAICDKAETDARQGGTDGLREIAAALEAESVKLGERGAAIRYLAEAYGKLAEEGRAK